MRFHNYINEEDMSKLKDFVQKKCKPFIKEFGKVYRDGYFVYRGLKSGQFGGWIVKKARKDRKPRVVHPKTHEYLQELSKEIFGWNMRTEGVFCAYQYLSEHYGTSTIFIPIGKYEYVYYPNSPRDLYDLYDTLDARNRELEEYEETLEKMELSSSDEEEIEEIEDEIEEMKNFMEKIEHKIFLEYEEYEWKRLPSYLKKKRPFEAIFRCDKYISINRTYEDDVANIFREIL